MSAFWIRRRNFILAVFLGIILGAVFMGGISFLIRGKINNLVNREEEEEPKLTEAIVLNKALKKGEVIKKEDLLTIEVEKSVEKALKEEEIWGQKLKINMHDNIPLTGSMLGEDIEYSDKDRLYEFAFIRLPRELEVGDFVDVRIRMHNGEDYVLISDKRINSMEKDETDARLGLIELALNEDEVLAISSAFVDTFRSDLTEVYLDRYIDGGAQRKSSVNYPINKDVISLLADNPNVLKRANIEELLSKRMLLDENLKKVVFENNSLLNYEIENKEEASLESGSKESGVGELIEVTEEAVNKQEEELAKE